MINHHQFQKIICVFLIFPILIYFSGCYGQRIAISRTDLPLPDASKYYYVIHTQFSNYLIKNVIISNGILSGKMENYSSWHNKIHIYLSSDTIMKISPEKIINIPIDGIWKVVTEKVSAERTFILTIAIVGGTITVLYAGMLLLTLLIPSDLLGF